MSGSEELQRLQRLPGPHGSCCNWVPPGGCTGWLGPATTPSDGYITLNKALFFLIFLKQNKPKFTLTCKR